MGAQSNGMWSAQRISRRRYDRSRNRGRGGVVALKVLAVLLLVVVLGVSVAVASGLTGALAAYDYLTSDLPDFADLERLGRDEAATFETGKVYAWGKDEDGDGERDLVLIYEIIDPFGGDRQWLALETMPSSLINATVAIEDKTFWTNRGFDFEGIGRAFYQYTLKGGNVQGGSSITQQIVKNNLIVEERRIVGEDVGVDDYRRKVEEVLLAQEITRVYSKEQILEWYVNTNFYGNLAYGIEAAARIYFNKPASQLDVAESAMLAAIPQSPAMNPIDNPEQAKLRQHIVLDSMLRDGYLTVDEVVAAKAARLEIAAGFEDRFDIKAPHFAFYVRRQLEQMFGPAAVLRSGLRVYTTLDLEMQAQAECVAREHVARLSGETDNTLTEQKLVDCPALANLRPLGSRDVGVDHDVSNASVLAIDPKTGEIKVMVGSLDYWNQSIDGEFNVAADGLRQPGSSFKPFTYLTALSEGYTPAAMFLDVETDFGTNYSGVAYVPQNYSKDFHGPVLMRSALANSYNVPAVEAMSWVGVEKVARMAHSMGITSLDKGPENYGLSLTLGGGEVKLIDMVYAFSVFDNMGRMIGKPIAEDQERLGFRNLEPVAISRVEDARGNLLYEYNQPQSEEIFSPQLAYLMNNMMSDLSARCPAFGCPNALELPGDRPVAAKTGTTNDYKDSWTVGYTPQLVTGVWVGNSDNTEMENVPGSKGAAPIWQAFMSWHHEGLPVEGWAQPDGIVRASVCRLSGLLPTSYCPTVSELFIEGTVPRVYDNMYQEFHINRESGRLATNSTPPELVETKVFVLYPDGAADWVRENKIEQPPTQYDDQGAVTISDVNAWIGSVQTFQYVSGAVELVGNARGDNFSYYRLAYFPGLQPGQITVIADTVPDLRNNEPLGIWDTSQLSGLYTVVLTVFKNEGSIEEYSVPVTVDNLSPSATIVFPLTDQLFFTDDEWVIVQAQVNDDLSIDRVEFFVDGAEVPFAISTIQPFTKKWTIPGPGCHSFKVVAFDSAGNRTASESVRVCVERR